MSEWKEYKLGEVAEITSSKRIFFSDYVNSGIPFYRSKEMY
jgi:type I restriction enzyme S subunit